MVTCIGSKIDLIYDRESRFIDDPHPFYELSISKSQ